MKPKLNPSKKRPQAGRTRALAVAPRSASVQPPIDNDHVAPGCQLFASKPVPKGWKFSDAERLDWLEKNYPRHGILGGSGEHVLWIVGYQFSGPTLRDAIDNAIRETWQLRDTDGRVPPL